MIHAPPCAIAGIEPISPRREAVVVVHYHDAGFAVTVIHVLWRQTGAAGNADDGFTHKMDRAADTAGR
jgi:hypothetical protein